MQRAVALQTPLSPPIRCRIPRTKPSSTFVVPLQHSLINTMAMPRQRRTGSIIPHSTADGLVCNLRHQSASPQTLPQTSHYPQQQQNISSEDEDDLPEPPTYAPLHDFCMMIPYGVASIVIGIGTALLRGALIGWATAINGVVMCALASLSLRSWKANVLSKAYAVIGFGMWGVGLHVGYVVLLMMTAAIPPPNTCMCMYPPHNTHTHITPNITQCLQQPCGACIIHFYIHQGKVHGNTLASCHGWRSHPPCSCFCWSMCCQVATLPRAMKHHHHHNHQEVSNRD